MPSWNERYAGTDHVYGTEPNAFLVEQAGRLPPAARVVSLGEGEGRNAVFLASRGLSVLAIDGSDVGLAKARRLAEGRGLTLETQCADLEQAELPGTFDAAINIFCHLPSGVRRKVHRHVLAALKPGGLFIIELYRPEQIPLGTGGPKDADMLASIAALREDLEGCDELLGRELERDVVEGTLHTGRAAVVQAVMRRR